MDNFESSKSYYKELSKIPVIDKEKQIELAKKAKRGDEKSLEMLIKGNLRFVVTIAKEYNYNNIALGDLINEGNIGLIKAVDRFDADKGIHFISYAVWWIRQSIMQFIYNNGELVRLPINRINLRNKIKKAIEILYKDLQRHPSIEEIYRLTDIPKKDIKNYLNSHKDEIEIKVSYENNLLVAEEYTQDEDFNKIEKNINRHDASQAINKVLKTLNKRESTIIQMYFGLNGGPSLNLREISKKLLLTNERVRQIKDFALKKMRTRTNSYSLREFLNSDI